MESTESETSSVDIVAVHQQICSNGTSDTRGKHRILADMNRLDQESRFLEEELEELEKTENVSATCQELLLYVESRSDPLLSVTSGPANPLWDRWFEGGKEMKDCRCSIL